ncbi:MAG: hypothetical protein KME37_07740 [Candidatus Thiodiazotropha sp. (ex Codakia orbicularis)]|nr:hypothetical protein [Candidatus Thiodiazotropha sp. (ex Codakia orbicularis)]
MPDLESIQAAIAEAESKPTEEPVEPKQEMTGDEAVEAIQERIDVPHEDTEDELIEDQSDWEQPSSKPQHQANPNTEQLQSAMSENLRQRAALEAQYNQINWQELREDDPGEYAAQRQQFMEADYNLQMQEQQLNVAYQQITGQDTQKQQQQMEEYIQGEQSKLMDAIPAWRDKAVRQKESQMVRNYLRKQGFADAEIDSVVDHRAIKIVRDSMLANQRVKNNKVVMKRKVKKSVNQGKYTHDELRTLKEHPHSIDAIALRIRERMDENMNI